MGAREPCERVEGLCWGGGSSSYRVMLGKVFSRVKSACRPGWAGVARCPRCLEGWLGRSAPDASSREGQESSWQGTGISDWATAVLGMGLLLEPEGGPHYGSTFWTTFRYHRNDNAQSGYHCGDIGFGAEYWTLKRAPGTPSKQGPKARACLSV